MQRSEMEFRHVDACSNVEYVQRSLESLYDPSVHSFFNSPDWFLVWLKTLPETQSLEFIEGWVEEKRCAAFFLGRQSNRLFGLPMGCSYYFNATGDSYLDELTIEYNSILGDQSYCAEVVAYLQQRLKQAPFNSRVLVPGAVSHFLESGPVAVTAPFHNAKVIDLVTESRPSWYVNLDKVNGSASGYTGLLGKNRREQIRRSLRLFEEMGELTIHEAASSAEAADWFGQMAALNRVDAEQRQRGQCYVNDYFLRFHHSLIEAALGGTVMLYRFAAGDTTIGFIYGFLDNGRFLYYQSGFEKFQGNRLKPGQSCHALLIEKMAKEGLKEYDFLAGTERYKQSLASDKASMQWIMLSKNGCCNRLLKHARRFLKGNT